MRAASRTRLVGIQRVLRRSIVYVRWVLRSVSPIRWIAERRAEQGRPTICYYVD
ncbi:MAG: hypothetical protein JXQ75_00275 [Phycisphaerae bacterium]|nr:hypothetical protein [Phycisphaerae bacterium]